MQSIVHLIDWQRPGKPSPYTHGLENFPKCYVKNDHKVTCVQVIREYGPSWILAILSEDSDMKCSHRDYLDAGHRIHALMWMANGLVFRLAGMTSNQLSCTNL